LVATPGPGVLYVTARSFDQGRRAGLMSMLGIEGAELVYIAATAAGLSAILAASTTSLTAIRFAGAAYLITLGIRHWRGREAPLDLPRGPAHYLLAQGFVIQLLNPKVAVFFVAYFPQFLDPAAPDGFRVAATPASVPPSFPAYGCRSNPTYCWALSTPSGLYAAKLKPCPSPGLKVYPWEARH
jgi:threonine/homoserine/homoserine lactone efflux protein